MEEACHELDLRLALQRGLLDVSFGRYTKALRDLYSLKEESQKQSQVVAVLDQLSTYLALTLPEDSPALEKIRGEAKVQRDKLKEIVRGNTIGYCIFSSCLHRMDESQS